LASFPDFRNSFGWSVTLDQVPNKLKVNQIKRESVAFYDSLFYVNTSPGFGLSAKGGLRRAKILKKVKG